MINIAICDDDERNLEVIEKNVRRSFEKYTNKFRIECYKNGKNMLNNNSLSPYDVLFLDIDMPNIDGFEIAKELRNSTRQCFIIFVTSHSNLVYKSFDFQPFNFIQKNPPEYMEDSILSVVGKLMEHMKQHQKIILENENETAVVYYNDIIYIESEKHYLKYHINNRDNPINIRGTINEIQPKIEPYGFVRIHRGFIVNLTYLMSIDKKIGKVYIKYKGTKKSLSIGTSYKDSVIERYTMYLRSTL